MYDTALLDDLAHDPDVAANVRTLAGELIQAHPTKAERPMPVRAFGPDHPGVLLRLDPRFTGDLSQASQETIARLLEVQDRLHTALA